MKKRTNYIFVSVAIVLLTLALPLILAAEDDLTDSSTEQDRVDAAYDCLENELGDDCTDLNSFEEVAFAVLALGGNENCDDKLLTLARDEKCWPSANCKVKETAIAMLALERANKNTDKVQAWLMNQTKPAANLEWFLQIESNGATACTISYPSEFTINIGEDRKIDNSAGNCLTLAQGDYWLKIGSECLDKEFTISCVNSFETTLLYKKPDSSTVYVSQNVQSAVAGGTTTEEVVYQCFGGTVCEYEGSLWTALALIEKDEEVSKFIPYLDAFAEDNQKYFPETFLYMLTGSSDFFTSVLSDNFNSNFWHVGSETRYYNTALAFLALQGQDPDEVTQSKEALLSSDLQEVDGCWKGVNTRDTAFLLYAGWPESTGGGGGGDDPGGSGEDCLVDSDCPTGEDCVSEACVIPANDDCESNGNYCLTSALQCDSVSGVSYSEFDCPGFQTCCSANLQTCSEQLGEVCYSDEGEECPSGSQLASSSTGTCCSETCIDIEIVQSGNPCENTGYTCKSICSDDEEEREDLECDSISQTCCRSGSGGDGEKSSWWIWVLLILIVLAAVGIVFRNKLRLMLFKRKSKFRKGPGPRQTRPGLPPTTGPNILRPRAPPRHPVRPAQRTVPRLKKDNEFEDTLKKLKEMGK